MLLQREYDLAVSAARSASSLVSSIYATDFSVDYKGIGDPVTEADRRANELIVTAIHSQFPSDAVCAEEGDTERSARASEAGGRCWFVDPIDGTQEFVNRNGEFCVMIGLAIDGRATLGVLIAPVWKRSLAGVVGVGAWEILDDNSRRPLCSAAPSEASSVRVAVSRSHRNRAVDRAIKLLGAARSVPCGSVGLKVALVATGQADLYLQSGPGPKLWDGCAPEAVAVASGAKVTNGYGEPLRYDTRLLALDRGIVVAREPLHSLAQRCLADAIAEG